LRKSIRVAFSDGYSGAAAMTGWDMGIRTAKPKHWTRPDRGLPRFDNLPDCRRWHKLSATLSGDLGRPSGSAPNCGAAMAKFPCNYNQFMIKWVDARFTVKFVPNSRASLSTELG
jgi:hypothetical protein